jgi:hypothetical protein
MVDFGSGRGLSVFAIPPKAGLRVSIPRIAKKRKRSPGPKDAVSGWTQVNIEVHTMGNDRNGYVTDYRSITIKTTDGSTINGKVNLTSKQRVSDLFTDSKSPFLIMVDAITRDGSGKILFVNKEHIVWAEPEE